MKINKAEFITSSAEVDKCPPPSLPEYAFIGRSNVGKSSLINMLTGRNKLAKTSGTPGKTQLINHFKIDDTWYIVDLPGYGYAKVSKKDRAQWDKMIRGYLTTRKNLMCVMVLLDSRHDPQKNDLEFMEWLGKNEIPFVMVFTKADKLSSSNLSKNLKKYQQEMLNSWEFLPQVFTTSSTTNIGQEQLLNFIEETNEIYS